MLYYKKKLVKNNTYSTVHFNMQNKNRIKFFCSYQEILMSCSLFERAGKLKEKQLFISRKKESEWKIFCFRFHIHHVLKLHKQISSKNLVFMRKKLGKEEKNRTSARKFINKSLQSMSEKQVQYKCTVFSLEDQNGSMPFS